MSYSSDIKHKLTLSDIRSVCCAQAELYSAVLMNGGNVFLSKDKNYIKRICALSSKSRGLFVRVRTYTVRNKKGSVMWGTVIRMQEKQDLSFSKQCCAAAFIRGCFIRSGYINPPDKTARADISFKNKDTADMCGAALDTCGIHYNVSVRNRNILIYIKSSENVSSLLARIGAVGAMLELENSSIIKKYKNDVNRVTNCDNANLDKTVSAAVRQKALISEFMKTSAFDGLPIELKKIAKLRADDESLSLKDIGMMLSPPISKSGAAHRLKKIEDIANKILS